MKPGDGDDKMKDVAKIIGTIGSIVISKEGRKFLCGTYADGSPRSLKDALNGEIYSPKEKDKKLKKHKKAKKKNKKNKKKLLKGYDGIFRF